MIMAAPKFCSLCGQPLLGNGAIFKSRQAGGCGLSVCHRCLRSSPRCPLCRAPIRPNDSNHCPFCGGELLSCRLCGQAIIGPYVEVNGRGPFCETCYQTRPICAACGSLATDGGRALPDGRHVCPVCDRTAVYNEATARALFGQLKAIVSHKLGLSLNIPTPVYLVDRDQLAAVARQLDNKIEPLSLDQSLGVYLRQGRRRGIYVLLGLPQTLLTRVLAHEWAHAWQAERNPYGGKPLVWEGFAEWVAYKTMAELGQTDALRQMRARTDVYGDGLRRMLHIEGTRGVEGVLAIVRRE